MMRGIRSLTTVAAMAAVVLSGGQTIAEDGMRICQAIAATANGAAKGGDDAESSRALLRLLPPGMQRLDPEPVEFSDLARLYGCKNDTTCDAPVSMRFLALGRDHRWRSWLVDSRPWSNQTFVMASYTPYHVAFGCDALFGFQRNEEGRWKALPLPFDSDGVGKTVEECSLEFAVFRLGDKPYLAVHTREFPPFRPTIQAIRGTDTVSRKVFDPADASASDAPLCAVNYTFTHRLATAANHPLIAPEKPALHDVIGSFLDANLPDMAAWMTLEEEVGETVSTDTRFVFAKTETAELVDVKRLLASAPKSALSKSAIATVLGAGGLDRWPANKFVHDSVNWETRFFPVGFANRTYVGALMHYVGPSREYGGPLERPKPLIALFRVEDAGMVPAAAFELRTAYHFEHASAVPGH